MIYQDPLTQPGKYEGQPSMTLWPANRVSKQPQRDGLQNLLCETAFTDETLTAPSAVRLRKRWLATDVQWNFTATKMDNKIDEHTSIKFTILLANWTVYQSLSMRYTILLAN